MTTSTVCQKKRFQETQRAFVDGLEDVKAQDIQVFDTEHLSALFERHYCQHQIARPKLAGEREDAVRDAGFPKASRLKEANEVVIVLRSSGCARDATNFRQYYNLEELWGENQFI
jgi:ribosome-associated protein